MNEIKVLPGAHNIALKVAAGIPLDYITITYGRRAGTQMRYWPWLALEHGAEPSNYDWPVKEQKVVIETTCEGVSEQDIDSLVEVLRRPGAGTIIVLRRYSDNASVIDSTRWKDISRAKALALLAKKRKDFYEHIPVDDDERRLMLELSHEGLQELVRAAAQFEEAA